MHGLHAADDRGLNLHFQKLSYRLHGEKGLNMEKKLYHIRFRCYFGGRDNCTNHDMILPLAEIGKWMDAYMYTHPQVQSITAKIWPQDKEADA